MALSITQVITKIIWPAKVLSKHTKNSREKINALQASIYKAFRAHKMIYI